jgi:23S rRNA pseudouridine1911/1915/1917 synthase
MLGDSSFALGLAAFPMSFTPDSPLDGDPSEAADPADPLDAPEAVVHTFAIPETQSPDRLDKILAQLMPAHSRGRLQGWIEREHVKVNGAIASGVRHKVWPGDRLTVTEEEPPESRAFMPEAVDFPVIAESADWIVVDKPVGLVVHPGAGNWSGTLLNGLLHRYPALAQVPRAGIVHRLDKDTSGLMVVARTIQAQTHLVRQLQARTVGRRYVALVSGHVRQAGRIDLAIGRDARVPVRMSVDRAIAPKPAITHYQPQRFGVLDGVDVTEVACKLETGRTHQIRVHMASLGHPLLADTLYGGKALPPTTRQMLHARALHFQDPATEQGVEFSAELPADMQAAMAAIEWIDTSAGRP